MLLMQLNLRKKLFLRYPYLVDLWKTEELILSNQDVNPQIFLSENITFNYPQIPEAIYNLLTFIFT